MTFTTRAVVTLVLLALLSSLSVAQTAPEFALADSQGRAVSLADFKGKPLILHFWATWCPYCKKLQPGLERLSAQYRDRDLVLLGISFSEDDGAQPQKALEARGHTFKTLVLGDEVATEYGVKGTPTTFFIDRDGIIKAVTHTSEPNDPILKSSAELIVGG